MPSPDRASPHASLAPSPPQFTKTAPAHLTSNSHPSPAPQSSHSSHAHTAATPRAAFLTTPPSPTHQVPTVTTPTVPRLDVRKLATLSQIRLPDSVLTLTARSHGATNPTLISKLSYARPQTDRPAIRSPATHRQIISPPTPTPVPLTTNTAPPPLSSATSPALLAYQTQKRLSKKTRQPNAIDTFGYRPSSLEDSDLMDQRIKNNKRAMEAAEAASKEANGSDDEDAADDMTGRLSPMSLKQAELSAVFKIEGHVVRTLIMSLNPRNIRWLRNEFEEGSDPANHDCITGPQFIKCMSKVFNEPDIMLDEDKGLDSSMRTSKQPRAGSERPRALSSHSCMALCSHMCSPQLGRRSRATVCRTQTCPHRPLANICRSATEVAPPPSRALRSRRGARVSCLVATRRLNCRVASRRSTSQARVVSG